VTLLSAQHIAFTYVTAFGSCTYSKP